VLCSWCDHAATTYLIPDGRGGLDMACPTHAVVWGHLYRRSVPIAASIKRAAPLLELLPA
jgi:hypothetical protein